MQAGRRIRASAAQTAAERNALVDIDTDAVFDLETLLQQVRGGEDQIVLLGDGAVAMAPDGRTVGRAKHQLIAQIDELLDDNPLLKTSLSRRDAYLDPLNHIQLELLERYRSPETRELDREASLDPLLRSINAIAGGMRNTG